MTTIADREKALENKFARDQELKFKAIARRNKMLGLWAAELLRKADKDAYAKEVVLSDFSEAGDNSVLQKLRSDFDAAGVAVTDQEIRVKMMDLLASAALQVEEQ